MKNTYIIIFSFLSLLLGTSRSVAQSPQLEKLSRMPSPQAADLGRYGDIPMSYYTGRANVVIPIHSFSERGVTLNINLNYDSGGLLLNQLPGWVGPGWTLNAGGCITRVQNNMNDELTSNSRLNLDITNYFDSYSNIVSNGEPDSACVFSWNDLTRHDYSPDIFYFNFLGHTGHFFLGNDGQWKVSSDDNLVVEFDVDDSNNYMSPVIDISPGTYNGTDIQSEHYSQSLAIKGFKLYDDEGNKYTFGYNTNAVDYSIDLFKTSIDDYESTWVATAWHLTKVEDRFGNELFRLTYSRGKFIAQLYNVKFLRFVSYTYPQVNLLGDLFGSPDPLYADGWEFHNHNFSGTLNLPCYLSDIETYSGKSAHFLMNESYPNGTASRQLYPSLYTSTGLDLSFFPPGYLNKQYSFYYLQNPQFKDYWSTTVVDREDPLSAIELNFLSSISVCLGTNTIPIIYNFSYDTTGRKHLSGVSINSNNVKVGEYGLTYYDYDHIPPDYLTEDHDAWGYYPQNDIPLDTLMEVGNDGSISFIVVPNLVNISFDAAGLLKKISYPTGGYSLLEYEQNDYSSKLSNNRDCMILETGIAGGARVTAITDYLDDSTVAKRRTFSYKTTGSTSSGQLFATPTLAWSWYVETRGPYQTFCCVEQITPVIPLATHSGIHVGYSNVTETLSDGTSHHYHYSNFSDTKDNRPTICVNMPTVATPYNCYEEFDFMRGRLLSETVKDSIGSVFLQKDYIYRTDTTNYLSRFSYGAYSKYFAGNPFFTVGAIYKLYYPKYDLESMTIRTRYGNGLVKDSVKYFMSDYNSINNDTTYFRKCSSENTYRGTDYKKNIYGYQSFITDKYFLPLVSVSDYHGTHLQETKQTHYATFNGHSLPQMETRTITDGVIDTLVTYNTYTSTGRPSSYRQKGRPVSYLFWNSGDKLAASVSGVSGTSILTLNTSATSPLNVVKVNGQSIYMIPGAEAFTYLYNNQGLLSASAERNGQVKYYYYDYMGRLNKICDGNGKTIQRFSYHFKTGEIPILNP